MLSGRLVAFDLDSMYNFEADRIFRTVLSSILNFEAEALHCIFYLVISRFLETCMVLYQVVRYDAHCFLR